MAGPIRAVTDFLGLTSDWRANDAALRNMNPNAFYYGGEGRDTFVNEVNNAARFADQAAGREMNVDASGYNVDRTRDTLASQQQNRGLGMLYNTAMGRSPSIAQMQAGNQVAQAAANMRAQAASARGGGGNAAAAMRTAIRQGGSAGVAAANQGGMLRAQEMLNAQNAYMQGASQVRGQEQARMGQSQNWALGNTAAQQANRNANDASRQFFEAQRQGMFQGNQQGQQAGQQYRANVIDANNRINAQMEGAGPLQAAQAIATGVGGAVGMMSSPSPQPQQQGGYAPQPGTAGYQSNYGGQNNPYGPNPPSDERLKENVSDGGPALRSALDSLDPKSFRYKDQGLGEGQRLGIMAQDMERTPYGKAIVEEGQDGKVIEAGGGLNMALAAIADLHKRMKKFEGKK